MYDVFDIGNVCSLHREQFVLRGTCPAMFSATAFQALDSHCWIEHFWSFSVVSATDLLSSLVAVQIGN